MNNMSDCYYKKLERIEKSFEEKDSVERHKKIFKYIPCKYLGKQEYTESYFDGYFIRDKEIEKYLIEVDGKILEVYPPEVFIR